ncbi:MAG: DEAD/DEAH box helicase [Bacteroidetes bacterium 4572_77]|nr:MAG: DEAD/DEAH box helicase [Bacteroidetes bacterium 4572_77]
MIRFDEMGLAPEVVKAIGELGFESPTPIQEKCIPFLYQNSRDLVANAQTGTGKTAAFGLPIIGLLDPKIKSVQALILSPTRELGMQIAKDIKAYTKYSPDINVVAVYGGASMDVQIKELKRGGQVVVGTPGRVADLIRRSKLKVGGIKWLVLDEADEMLSMGFKDELDAILSNTPEEKQTLLFSATMPKGIESIAKKYMDDPEKIVVGKKNAGADNVRHFYYKAQAKDRYLVLKRIVDMSPGIYGIVFCRTRRETNEVAEHLMKDGYNADALHGDLSQPQREYVMARFHSRNLQILVATDVAARGLDVDSLTHVINYNLPDDAEIYVHRSGRTGRAGKSGVSISIVHGREQHRVKMLQKMLNKKFEQELIPTGPQVCERQLFHLVDKMEHIAVDEKQIAPYLDTIYEKLEAVTREDLIKRFVSVEFTRFLDYYSDARDLNMSTKPDRRDKFDEDQNEGGKKHKKGMEYSRFYVNLGIKNGINPGKIIRLITDEPSFKSLEIGSIELFKKFSFFEVDRKFEKEVIKHFEDLDYNGIKVSIELSNSKANKPENNKSRSHSSGGGKPWGKKSYGGKRNYSGGNSGGSGGGSRKKRY